MKALILNNPGIESFVKDELSTLGITIIESSFGGVLCESDDPKKILQYAYQGLGPSSVLAVLGSFILEKEDVAHILSGMESVDLSSWINTDRSIAVRTTLEPLDTSRRDLEAQVGAMIVKTTGCSVNLDKPDVPVLLTRLGKHCYVTVDLCGVDLGKRDYRLFFGRENIKAPIAAFAVWKCKAQPGQVIVDPFCRNGVVIIEAAHHYTKKSVNYYQKDKFTFPRLPQFKDIIFDDFFSEVDSLQQEIDRELYAIDESFQHISSAKKNAKIAGMEKQIHFSRTGCDWLDTKFEKESVNHLVSFVPQVRRGTPKSSVDKLLRELFYQASFMLHPEGTVVCITKDTDLLEAHATHYKFVQQSCDPCNQGAETFSVVVYAKKRP